MKFKNLSRVERNMLTGLFCQFVTILLSFLMPRLYLTYYGSGVNGELNTIKQLFAYLYLLEAGVGLATTQALYRPVAMEEHQTVSEILAATDHYYRRTGTLYALIVVAIGVVYPMVVHFTLPRGVVLLYTILYGLPSVTSFFVQGKYRLLMDVDGRRYVLSNLETATNLISGIGKVLVLMLTRNLLAMQLLYCLCSMLPIPVILWYTHKNYPWIDHHAKPDYSAVAQKNSAETAGNPNVMVTERGVSFGYNTLVVDMRSLPIMAQIDDPNCEVNQLNAAGYVTVFNGYGTGLRLWGNRSARVPRTPNFDFRRFGFLRRMNLAN